MHRSPETPSVPPIRWFNLRLGAVRRLAYEAADSGLLSADLAAGVRRVKGVKKLGIRLGNCLTPERAKSLWQAPDTSTLPGKRDRALLAMLATVDHLQQLEGHWAIVDLVGKGRHIRTIPMPDWGYGALSEWTAAAGVQGALSKSEQRRQAVGRGSDGEAGLACC
jgi:site-specific recombinase XerC